MLLAGARGVVGQLILERLLRAEQTTCYCLIRSKRGLPAMKRLEQLLALPLFDPLRQRDPDFAHRARLVEADLLDEDFVDDRGASLRDRVDVVINSAGCVRFELPLDKLLEQNVWASLNLLRWSQQPDSRVRHYMYISTAFQACDIARDDEPVPEALDPAFSLEGWFNERPRFNDLPRTIRDNLSRQPNRYTFTKKLTERMLDAARSPQMQLSIVRPTVVTTPMSEPLPGWCESLQHAMIEAYAIGRGEMGVQLRNKPGCYVNAVPADMTVDLVEAICQRLPQPATLVYHSDLSSTNADFRRDCLARKDRASVAYFKAHPLPPSHNVQSATGAHPPRVVKGRLAFWFIVVFSMLLPLLGLTLLRVLLRCKRCLERERYYQRLAGISIFWHLHIGYFQNRRLIFDCSQAAALLGERLTRYNRLTAEEIITAYTRGAAEYGIRFDRSKQRLFNLHESRPRSQRGEARPERP